MAEIKEQKYVNEAIQEYRFIYDGPVMCFGKVISEKFKSSTIATSKKKALVNIIDQYKRWNGLGKRYKIELNDDCIHLQGQY